MKNKLGSNQFKTRNKYPLGLSYLAYINVLELIVFILVIGIVSYFMQPKIISPLSDNPIFAAEPEKEPIPEPTPENIIAYIAKVFKPEGTSVVVKAINCFYSESGLKNDAEGWNPPSTKRPGSFDWGVAQINSYFHRVDKDEMFDFRKNIDFAYKIYKGRKNFSAWYGKGCK